VDHQASEAARPCARSNRRRTEMIECLMIVALSRKVGQVELVTGSARWRLKYLDRSFDPQPNGAPVLVGPIEHQINVPRCFD